MAKSISLVFRLLQTYKDHIITPVHLNKPQSCVLWAHIAMIHLLLLARIERYNVVSICVGLEMRLAHDRVMQIFCAPRSRKFHERTRALCQISFLFPARLCMHAHCKFTVFTPNAMQITGETLFWDGQNKSLYVYASTPTRPNPLISLISPLWWHTTITSTAFNPTQTQSYTRDFHIDHPKQKIPPNSVGTSRCSKRGCLHEKRENRVRMIPTDDALSLCYSYRLYTIEPHQRISLNGCCVNAISSVLFSIARNMNICDYYCLLMRPHFELTMVRRSERFTIANSTYLLKPVKDN